MADIQINFKQTGETSTQAHAGPYNIIIDRPVEKGGNGEGPMGGQVLLMGVGGCFCSTLIGAAKARGLEVKDLGLRLFANISDDAPKRFTHIRIEIISGSCNKENEFEKLIKIAENGCISVNTMKQGIEVKIENTVAA